MKILIIGHRPETRNPSPKRADVNLDISIKEGRRALDLADHFQPPLLLSHGDALSGGVA
jgi:hypothetical protein